MAARLGFALEATVVAVSCLDVVTDTALAWDLYSRGHVEWAAPVALSFVTAGALYAVMAVEWDFCATWPAFQEWRARRPTLHRIVAILLLLPVSQLIPFALWIHAQWQSRRLSQQLGDDLVIPDSGDDDREGVAAATDDSGPDASVEAAVADDVAGMSQADADFGRAMARTAEGLRRHRMFVVEAVVESIPQLAVQFAAAAAIGTDASPVQLYSLAASLLSLCVRAHAVCGSFSRHVAWWKYACVCYDIFSFFFAFATVGSHSEPRDVEWGSVLLSPFLDGGVVRGLFVSAVTSAWLTKLVWASFLDSVAVLAFLVTCVCDHFRGGTTHWTIPGFRSEDMNPLTLTLVLLLAAAPFLLILDGFRLTLLVALLRAVEPASDDQANAQAVFFPFWRGGSTARTLRRLDFQTGRRAALTCERNERLRHIIGSFAQARGLRSPGSKNACEHPVDSRETVCRLRREACYRRGVATSLLEDRVVNALWPPEGPFDPARLPNGVLGPLSLFSDLAIPRPSMTALDEAWADGWDDNEIRRAIKGTGIDEWPPPKSEEKKSWWRRVPAFFADLDIVFKVNLLMWLTLISVQIPSAIFGALFPMVHFLGVFAHRNTAAILSRDGVGTGVLSTPAAVAPVQYDPLQWLCLVCCAVCLFGGVLPLLPTVADYFRYCQVTSCVAATRKPATYCRTPTRTQAIKLVTNLLLPSPQAVLRFAVPNSAILPVTLLDDIAAFLARTDLRPPSIPRGARAAKVWESMARLEGDEGSLLVA